MGGAVDTSAGFAVTGNHTYKVWFEVSINGAPATSGTGDRIVMQLRPDVVPRTSENFRALCTGEKGKGLTYRGCVIHRVIPEFMCQSGDITNGDGTGGRSIWSNGATAPQSGAFNDENFELTHDGPGTLSMANSGPHTNTSQFFLTLAKTAWLDGKHVVFGRVIDGLHVLEAIERVGSESGNTNGKVVITDCGEYPIEVPAAVAAGATDAAHPNAPPPASSGESGAAYAVNAASAAAATQDKS